MDVELQERLRGARPPFDGLTIAADAGMPLSLVRAILVRVVPFLEARWPVARLYTLHDWHAQPMQDELAEPARDRRSARAGEDRDAGGELAGSASRGDDAGSPQGSSRADLARGRHR